MQEVLQRAKDRRSHFEIKVVQPGISKTNLSAAIAEILEAANLHMVGVGIAPLGVITSLRFPASTCFGLRRLSQEYTVHREHSELRTDCRSAASRPRIVALSRCGHPI